MTLLDFDEQDNRVESVRQRVEEVLAGYAGEIPPDVEDVLEDVLEVL